MTNVVVYVDGSHAADEALRYAARTCHPAAKVLLLHVVPSARAGALRSGEKVLERAYGLYTSLAGEAAVATRLEVGSPVACIAAAADDADAEAIIMGSHDLGAFPRVQVLGSAAEGTVSATDRLVILVFPEGSDIVPAAEPRG